MVGSGHAALENGCWPKAVGPFRRGKFVENLSMISVKAKFQVPK